MTLSLMSFNSVVVSELPEFKIYPNPVTEEGFEIISETEIVSIEVINILGKTIYRESFIEPVKRAHVQLQAADKGIYILRLESSDKKISAKKFVIK